MPTSKRSEHRRLMAMSKKKENVRMPQQDSGVVLRRTRRLPPPPEQVTGSDGTNNDVFSTDNKSEYLSGSRKAAQYENTYKILPDLKFVPKNVEHIVESIMKDRLIDLEYEPMRCKAVSQELATVIMDRLKAMVFKRYKVVAVVSIGSLRERPGMQFGSRCLWNQQTDSFVSVKYSNGSLFAVAMVYGLYFE